MVNYAAVVDSPAQLVALSLAADPEAWSRAGFTVAGGEVRLGSARVRLAGADAGRGAVGWDLAGPLAGDLDGLPLPGVAAPSPGPAAVHLNGIATVDHVVAFTSNLDRSVAAVQRAGLQLRRRRNGPTGGGSARQAFFWLGDVILELVEHPPQAREAGDPDAPARLWGLALVAPDLDATAEAVGDDLLGQPRDAIQPGRRIATFSRAAALGVAVAVMSPHPQSRA